MMTTPPFPAQALPDWMTYILVTDPFGAPTWSIVPLPLTYYGPSIPLGTDGVWTYGGLTPPATASPVITQTQPPALTTPTVTVQLTVTPAPPATTFVATIATSTTTVTGTVSVGAEGSADRPSTGGNSSTGGKSSTGGNSPSTTNTHIFPPVDTTPPPTQNPVNAHTYLGLPPDSFLGLVIGISVLVLLSLLCCIAAILFCWRRRKRDRQPNRLSRAERRALLKSHQLLPDPSEREKDASFVANLASQQTSRLLAGDRSPRDRSLAKSNAPTKEIRKSEIALMRARGELPEWNDVPGLSPSLTHPRLPDNDPSIAYGVHPSELDNGDRAWAAAGTGAQVGSHMRGSRSRNTSLRVANMPPPPVLHHTTSASGASGITHPALSQRPNLGVEPPTITTTRPGQTRHQRLESVDSMAGVPEGVYYASGVPAGASVAARKSTDELDKEFHSGHDTSPEFDIDYEMRGVDLADLAERGATPTGSSSDPHLQWWPTADIDDLNDEPPIGALGRTRSTHTSSSSGRSVISRRTRNLEDVTRTAMAYLESTAPQTGERSRLVHTPSNASSRSVSVLSPITRYDSPVERTEDIQNLAALPSGGHSPPRSRAAFSNPDSGLGQWVNRNRQFDSRVPEHPRTPLFQRLFDPILTRVRTVSQSARNRPQTPLVGNTPRPQEYAALPPEPELEERSSGGTSRRPSRDWNWKAGPTSYSSGASTSKDDFRKWGRMGGPSGAAPRSSYGGGSALRHSSIFGGGSNSQGGSRAGLSGDEETDRVERGEGSGLGLAGVLPVPEEQDITSAAPLPRSSSPHTPPRAPTREHADFGLRPLLPPAPVDYRFSQVSARTAGSQATQGTAYFDAKSTLASSARDAARGPSPLGQTTWSASRSLAGTPMMEPYTVGPQDIPSTSTSTPVQEKEITVTPQEQDEPYAPQGITPPQILAPTPQIQHARPVDVLDVPPPPASRDFRQQPSLSTVFSVGSLEAIHEAGQQEVTVADHGRRRSSSVAGPGHHQFGGFSPMDDSERLPSPGLTPNPRLAYLPFAPPMPESRPPSSGQPHPRPRSADVAQLYQAQLRRLSRASNGAGSQGSATSSYGELLPGGVLSEHSHEADDLEEDPPMAASQWRVLRGYRRVSNVPDRGEVEGSGTDSSAAQRPGVGSRQHTLSARQAEEQASYRLTLGQSIDITSTSPGPQNSVVVLEGPGSIHSHRASTHSGNGSSSGNNSQRSKESSNKSHNGAGVSEHGRLRPRTLSNPLSVVAHSLSAIIGRRDSGAISVGPSTDSPTRQTFWRRGAQELDSPPLSAVPPLLPLPRSPLGRSPPQSPTRHQHLRSEDTHTMVSSSHGHSHGHGRSPTVMSMNTLADTTVEDIPKDQDEDPAVHVPLSDVEEILEPGQTPHDGSGTEDESNRQFTAAHTTPSGDTWLLVPRWAA